MRMTLLGCLWSRRGRALSAVVAVATSIGLTAGSAGAHGSRNAAAHPERTGTPDDFIGHIAWTSTTPAPGLELLTGTFSDPTVHPSWTVTIEAPTASPFDGSTEFAEAGSAAWAQTTESALSAEGFTPAPTRCSGPVTSTIRAASWASGSGWDSSPPRRRRRARPPR